MSAFSNAANRNISKPLMPSDSVLPNKPEQDDEHGFRSQTLQQEACCTYVVITCTVLRLPN